MKRSLKKTKSSIKYLDIFTQFKKKLKNFFSQTSENTDKIAKEDAETPPPEGTKLSIIPSIDSIKNGCSKILADCNKSLRGYMDVALTNYDQMFAKINDLLQAIQTKINDLQVAKSEALSAVVTFIKNKEIALSQSIKTKKDILKNLIQDLKKMKRYPIFWLCTIAIGLGLGFTIADVAYVAKAFELTGLNYLEQYLIAGGVGVATAILASGFVEILRSTWQMVLKVLGAVGCVVLVIALYVTIGQFRVQLAQKAMESGVSFSELTATEFALINLAIFSAVVVIHWQIWPSRHKFEANRNYNEAKRKVGEAKKELKAEQKKYDNLPDELAQKQTVAAKEYNTKIDALENEGQAHTDNLEEAEKTYNNIFGSLTEFYNEIDTFYKGEVSRYVAILNKYRNDGHYMLMDDSITDLPNPFADYHYANNPIPELTTDEVDYPDININFDELLTNTNNNNYENISENN